jgi:hypothetical protein
MEGKMTNCPIEFAHSRLMDFHEHIHRALESYFEPVEFRRNLNNALQDARNTTWLLQKQKSKFEDFETFYSEWQNGAQSNRVMKWSVSARNQVTKEADLTKSSKMVATLFTTKSILGEKSFDISPEVTTSACTSQILEKMGPTGNPKELILRIERLWVADSLPGIELTDALIEVYRNLKIVISRAHTAMHFERCDLPNQKRKCVSSDLHLGIDCFGSVRRFRTTAVSLKSGEKLELRSQVIERDESAIPDLLSRYGKSQMDEFSSDPYKHAPELLKILRYFIAKDGSTMPLLVAYGLNGEKKIFMIPMETDSSQSLMIQETLDSLGAWPFSTITFSTECWLSEMKPKSEVFGVPAHEFLPSSSEFDKSKLGEVAIDALAVYVIDRKRKPLTLIQPFANTKSGVVFGQIKKSVDWRTVPNSLKQISPFSENETL